MTLRWRTSTVTAVVVLAAGPGGLVPAVDEVAYPAPGPVPPVTEATLDDRYAATQRAVREASAVAHTTGDERQVEIFKLFRGRDLLRFDARGDGRAVEVIGDLAAADRIAVVVPGSHTTLDTFDRPRGPGGGARALATETTAVDPRTRVAAVAWLDYAAPQGASLASVTDERARAGAEALRRTVTELRSVNREAAITLLCHSYGSVVCGYAAAGLPVADVVFYGSPGVGADSAAELATTARVWAGRATDDWIRFAPAVRVAGIGFGTDPVSPAFGALPFPAGDGGHGDYHLPGGEALRSLARIVLGTAEPADGATGPAGSRGRGGHAA